MVYEEKIFVEFYGKDELGVTFIKSGNIIQESSKSNEKYKNITKNLSGIFKEVFLPQGYPDSVSNDYMEYQIWDTCQAFCSTINGTLTMRAVMEGVGVGNVTATPLAAAVTWIIKDGTGMFGRIIFAWLKGSELDSECKKWRLFADVLNDMAMGLELLVPYCLDISTWILCVSTCMKSLVGVAGGATRAALTSHQAVRGNLADVSAKDSSQETLVNLLASCLGLVLLQAVEGVNVGIIFAILTSLHLFFNYKAVKCLNLNKFNSSRYLLTVKQHLTNECISHPSKTNKLETVVIGFGMNDKLFTGFNINIGKSVKNYLSSSQISVKQLEWIMSQFDSSKYILLPDVKYKQIFIVVSSGLNVKDLLKSYYHAVVVAIVLSHLDGLQLPILQHSNKNKLLTEMLINSEVMMKQYDDLVRVAVSASHQYIDKLYSSFYKECSAVEWDFNNHQLQISEYFGVWNK